MTMAHGGARPGAGRKRGASTTRTREIADKAAEAGVTPLEFMLQVMRDEDATRAERLDMAKAAAPYIHPRLSAVEAKVDASVEQTISEIRRTVVDPGNPDA
ncbi:MAG: hypothetical protein ACOY4K_00500 [Pseudomonadota bacterium]